MNKFVVAGELVVVILLVYMLVSALISGTTALINTPNNSLVHVYHTGTVIAISEKNNSWESIQLDTNEIIDIPLHTQLILGKCYTFDFIKYTTPDFWHTGTEQYAGLTACQ
jgi:hypothetical protein